jgi:hypothetical protein
MKGTGLEVGAAEVQLAFEAGEDLKLHPNHPEDFFPRDALRLVQEEKKLDEIERLVGHMSRIDLTVGLDHHLGLRALLLDLVAWNE